MLQNRYCNKTFIVDFNTKINSLKKPIRGVNDVFTYERKVLLDQSKATGLREFRAKIPAFFRCSVVATRFASKSFKMSQDERVLLLKRKQQCEEQFGKDNGNASYISPLQQKIVRGPTAKQGRRQNRERCNSH